MALIKYSYYPLQTADLADLGLGPSICILATTEGNSSVGEHKLTLQRFSFN